MYPYGEEAFSLTSRVIPRYPSYYPRLSLIIPNHYPHCPSIPVAILARDPCSTKEANYIMGLTFHV